MPDDKPSNYGSLETPWLSLVLRADPTFLQDRRNELEYEFSNGRKFRANPNERGAYAPTPRPTRRP